MSLQACANLVARTDPDRFAAVMASPISARKVLLPVYAAAAEVARAPWLTQEHVIAEMRLQWWRDVFEEIEEGNPRRHEVVDALAEVLTAKGAKSMDTMVLARRWDIYKEGFKNPESLLKHVRDIALGPLVANLDALGDLPSTAEELHGTATQLGLAKFFRGVPALISLNVPVWSQDEKVSIYSDLCQNVMAMPPYGGTSPALIEVVGACKVLSFVANKPGSVEMDAIPPFALYTTLGRVLAAWKNN